MSELKNKKKLEQNARRIGRNHIRSPAFQNEPAPTLQNEAVPYGLALRRTMPMPMHIPIPLSSANVMMDTSPPPIPSMGNQHGKVLRLTWSQNTNLSKKHGRTWHHALPNGYVGILLQRPNRRTSPPQNSFHGLFQVCGPTISRNLWSPRTQTYRRPPLDWRHQKMSWFHHLANSQHGCFVSKTAV